MYPRDETLFPAQSAEWSRTASASAGLRSRKRFTLRAIRDSQLACYGAVAENAHLPITLKRPAAVEDRAVRGHWEGDLLSGPNNSYIATSVERHTRHVMLAKVAGKYTQTVVSDAHQAGKEATKGAV
jgi:IS30 family transposase